METNEGGLRQLAFGIGKGALGLAALVVGIVGTRAVGAAVASDEPSTAISPYAIPAACSVVLTVAGIYIASLSGRDFASVYSKIMQERKQKTQVSK